MPSTAPGADIAPTAAIPPSSSISFSARPLKMPTRQPAQYASPAPVLPLVKPSGSATDSTSVHVPSLRSETPFCGMWITTRFCTPSSKSRAATSLRPPSIPAIRAALDFVDDEIVDVRQAFAHKGIAIRVLADEIDRRLDAAAPEFAQYPKPVARVDLSEQQEIAEEHEITLVDEIKREVVVAPVCARSWVGEESPLSARNAHDVRKGSRRRLHHDAIRVYAAALQFRNGETPVVVIPHGAERRYGNPRVEDVDVAAGV